MLGLLALALAAAVAMSFEIHGTDDPDIQVIHAFPDDRNVCEFANTICYVRIGLTGPAGVPPERESARIFR